MVSLACGRLAKKLRVRAHLQVRRIHRETSQPIPLTLPEDSFRAHNCEKPGLEVQLTKHELLTMYREMQIIRRMEMEAEELYKAELVRGYCHLAIGQEAVSIGLEHGIDKNDRVITAYRCHPFALLRGGTIKGIVGELLGRQCGMSRGRGGSMHLFTPTFFGGNGIVGSPIPVGAGVALAQKYRGEKHCTFALYGDGASNQGQVFEAFNMAKIWNLPCVFICENNQYGLGTSAARSSSNTEYFTRGDKIPGLQVNGMDVIAIKQAAEWARKRTVEEQQGPFIIEFVTYRYRGHSASFTSSLDDPDTRYRTHEEVEQVRSTRDPIRTLRRYAEDWDVATEQELKQIDKDAKAEVAAAVSEAKESSDPHAIDLWADIYSKGNEPPFMRGRERNEVHHY